MYRDITKSEFHLQQPWSRGVKGRTVKIPLVCFVTTTI